MALFGEMDKMREERVTKEIIKKLSFSETPQMIIGVCKYLSYNENENFNKVLLLDGLQDPGNIGTLIRSALGFGIDLVVLSNDSVERLLSLLLF